MRKWLLVLGLTGCGESAERVAARVKPELQAQIDEEIKPVKVARMTNGSYFAGMSYGDPHVDSVMLVQESRHVFVGTARLSWYKYTSDVPLRVTVDARNTSYVLDPSSVMLKYASFPQ